MLTSEQRVYVGSAIYPHSGVFPAVAREADGKPVELHLSELGEERRDGYGEAGMDFIYAYGF